MLYFEVCVGDGCEEDSARDTWVCIRGEVKPSLAEADVFIHMTDSKLHGHVKSIYTIDEQAARDLYDFTREEYWPVFTKECTLSESYI